MTVLGWIIAIGLIIIIVLDIIEKVLGKVIIQIKKELVEQEAELTVELKKFNSWLDKAAEEKKDK